MTKLSERQQGLVNAIVAKISGHNSDFITEESNIKDDLGLDSLDEVEVIMEIEKEFDIEIPDCDAEEVVFVKDYYKAIEDKLK